MAYVLDVQENWLKGIISLSDYCAVFPCYISFFSCALDLIYYLGLLKHILYFKSRTFTTCHIFEPYRFDLL